MLIAEGIEVIVGSVFAAIGLALFFVLGIIFTMIGVYLLFVFKEYVIPSTEVRINLKTYKEIIAENPDFTNKIYSDFGIRKCYNVKVTCKDGAVETSTRRVNLTIPADIYYRMLCRRKVKSNKAKRYDNTIESFKRTDGCLL